MEKLEHLVAERPRKLSEANQTLHHKQHELEKANAELERLDELKSEFVALVSHELRAPLTNISGSLQILLHEGEANPLTPYQREMLMLADEQLERLKRLVKGVLNVARIEAGELPIEREAFDVIALIDRLLDQ
jgi:signal transduction histidine kinase